MRYLKLLGFNSYSFNLIKNSSRETLEINFWKPIQEPIKRNFRN